MSTFAQDTNHDLLLTAGRLVLVRDNTDSTAITLGNALQLWLGEWFQDTRIGMPYLDSILVKNPDLRLITQIFTKAILSFPGIIQIVSFVPTFNSKARTLSYTLSAKTDEGVTISGGTGAPFIVTGRA